VPIWGVDIHPRYLAGADMEHIRHDGFDFMAVKVSEARDITFMQGGSADLLRRARAAGILCLGYHHLHAGDEDTQARLFAVQLRIAGVPGLLDVEHDTGNVTNIRRFLDRCRIHGAHVPLMHLTRWYWQKIGSPDLSGLPPLWATRHVTGQTGSAPAMYQRQHQAGWAPYGGLGVEVLRFTDRANVAGRHLGANHYRGTREEFAALIMPTPDPVPDAAQRPSSVISSSAAR
jgi:hypothetical protein